MRLVLIIFILLLTTSNLYSEDTVARKSEKTKKYEAILYELGAFPVSKLTKKYFDDGNPGQVWVRGEREDIHGWLPPLFSEFYLTDAEIEQHGYPKKPLTFERYNSFIDVEEYLKSKDPLLFAIIHFSIQQIRLEHIFVKDNEKLISAYHARIGLEQEILWSIGDHLSGPEIVQLYEQHKDDLLLHYLKPPRKKEDSYRQFLEKLTQDSKTPPWKQQFAYAALFESAPEKYQVSYKNFLIEHVHVYQERKYIKDNPKHPQFPMQLREHINSRKRMNTTLLEFGDKESIKAVKKSLLTDPYIYNRKAILTEIKEKGKIPKFIDTLTKLSNGGGKECITYEVLISPFAPTNEYRNELHNFLEEHFLELLKKKKLSADLRPQIESALISVLRQPRINDPDSDD